MRNVFAWVASNLAWMALVYCSTRIYYRFKSLPAKTLYSLLGSLLATATGVIAVWWHRPWYSSFAPGTMAYCILLALAALEGPGMVGICLFLLSGEDLLPDDENHWFNQVAMPFYVSGVLVFVFMAVFCICWMIVNAIMKLNGWL